MKKKPAKPAAEEAPTIAHGEMTVEQAYQHALAEAQAAGAAWEAAILAADAASRAVAVAAGPFREAQGRLRLAHAFARKPPLRDPDDPVKRLLDACP